MDEVTLITDPHGCTGGCPTCCDETLQEIEAKNEARLKNRVMSLCSCAWIIILAGHVFFAWHGKTLALPMEIYMIFASPFGLDKLNMILKKLGGTKK